MANEQVNVPSLLVILLLSGLIVRYLFFTSPTGSARPGGSGSRANSEAVLRAREAAAERIQQMFPQVDRRTVLWDLQRTGGNVTATTERILAGRLETPPVTFQPPPPPGGTNGGANQGGSGQQRKEAEKPAQPDLITRYKLQDKLKQAEGSESESSVASGTGKGKAWSTNKEERQALLQSRRDKMILEARRKMEAKLAAEMAAAGSQ